MQNHIFPHWRSHSSLKGFCSINYPSTKQNPLLMHKRLASAELKSLYLKDRRNLKNYASAAAVTQERDKTR